MVGGRGDKIHFFDSAHQAGDYGWHIVDDHGLPYAHVFADPSISAGSDWISGTDAISVTASHEALEMLADPAAERVLVQRRTADVGSRGVRRGPGEHVSDRRARVPGAGEQLRASRVLQPVG